MRFLWLIPAVVTMLFAVAVFVVAAQEQVGWRSTAALLFVGLSFQASALAAASFVDR